MRVTITPSLAKGTVQAPPSKSMAHRLILCAGLSQGRSVISNVDGSQDILATIDCLKALGCQVAFDERKVVVQGIDIRTIDHPASLPCRECGSTLRFFIPVCLMSGQTMRLSGTKTLFQRPLTVYEDICRDQKLQFDKSKDQVLVSGRLGSGRYRIPGNISSQFISGLLFVLPLLSGDSVIDLIPPVESRPYIGMTMQALKDFGIESSWKDDHTITVKGDQHYLPCQCIVEGDYSNAAFFEALNLTRPGSGENVIVKGLKEDSLQGDKIYRQHFARLKEEYARIDIADCPDLGPVLMAVAALNHGGRFTGTRRLRIKESDRGLSMKEELMKMGVSVDLGEDEIEVSPGLKRPEEILDGHNDHRIVMALSVILTRTGGTIRGAEAVNKSLPDFFERLIKLGTGVRYDALD